MSQYTKSGHILYRCHSLHKTTHKQSCVRFIPKHMGEPERRGFDFYLLILATVRSDEEAEKTRPLAIAGSDTKIQLNTWCLFLRISATR